MTITTATKVINDAIEASNRAPQDIITDLLEPVSDTITLCLAVNTDTQQMLSVSSPLFNKLSDKNRNLVLTAAINLLEQMKR